MLNKNTKHIVLILKYVDYYLVRRTLHVQDREAYQVRLYFLTKLQAGIQVYIENQDYFFWL